MSKLKYKPGDKIIVYSTVVTILRLVPEHLCYEISWIYKGKFNIGQLDYEAIDRMAIPYSELAETLYLD